MFLGKGSLDQSPDFEARRPPAGMQNMDTSGADIEYCLADIGF